MPFDLTEFIKGLLLGEFGLEVKEVRKQEKSGVIYLPVKYSGRKVVILINEE